MTVEVDNMGLLANDDIKMRTLKRQMPATADMLKYVVVFIALTVFALWWTQPETVINLEMLTIFAVGHKFSEVQDKSL